MIKHQLRESLLLHHVDQCLVPNSPPALFIYDYALTFSKEIDLFWRKDRQAWSFVLFITNRYIGLLGRILELFRVFSLNSSGLDDSVFSNTAAVMMGRVYAFYNRDRRVLSLLVAMAMIPVGITGWGLSIRPLRPPSDKITTAPVTHAGCPDSESSVHYAWLFAISTPVLMLPCARASSWAAAWGGQMLFDALVFILTLRKLINSHSLGKRTFTALALRDGALYFAVMTVANVPNITTFLVMSDRLTLRKPFERSMLSVPTNTISLIHVVGGFLLAKALRGDGLQVDDQPSRSGTQVVGQATPHDGQTRFHRLSTHPDF
ncbi:hypothetical protein F5J12DRAFT_785707 [Pisolithus orientalis]|uniref:uncharacterized protein n=1 Tax=Pisolithus orientalis TaxID=936130 RepID=UPI002224F721|nr:uncharacterized protein F5J12DRAFT_785707 [Pisolithus orientalis]KAI5994909.1 hypothetical protein F5J12DRAFT_785707 [Pisolithus orientalis]